MIVASPLAFTFISNFKKIMISKAYLILIGKNSISEKQGYRSCHRKQDSIDIRLIINNYLIHIKIIKEIAQYDERSYDPSFH